MPYGTNGNTIYKFHIFIAFSCDALLMEPLTKHCNLAFLPHTTIMNITNSDSICAFMFQQCILYDEFSVLVCTLIALVLCCCYLACWELLRGNLLIVVIPDNLVSK